MLFRRAVVLTVALFAGMVFLSNAKANTFPPTPTSSYYGDADGDLTVTGADILQHRNRLLLKPSTYSTLQPAGANTEWNTCDVDSD